MISALLFAESANAHGSMVWPPTWFQPNAKIDEALKAFNPCGGKAACDWFSNYTFVEARTMAADSPMRTYAKVDPGFTAWDGEYDTWAVQNGNNPWAHPGSAKLTSPCGTFGGNPKGFGGNACGAGVPTGQACSGGGFAGGPDARVAYNAKSAGFAGSAFDFFDLQLTDISTTKVTQGGELDVNFVIQANHGGGYSYRLCKTPEDGDMTKLTEECFQQNPLKYTSPYSWVQWGPRKEDSIKFNATRSSQGTFPEGSVWTRNPIPACADLVGGIFSESGNNCHHAGGETQFEPVVPGVQGYGIYLDDGIGFEDGHPGVKNSASFPFTIGDTLQIPKSIAPGDYVLSWRWDCEQTPQVWNTCANLEITAPKTAAFSPPGRRPHPKRATA